MIEAYECVIVANGLFPSGSLALELLNTASFIIACDGAVIQLEKRGKIPQAVVGDLDSLSQDLRERYADRLHRVEDQETNDLTKAVNYAEAAGYKEVLILGATGLREDHTLGNISLLIGYASRFERVEMLSDYGWFTPVLHTVTLASYPGQPVSLFSLYPHQAISVQGLLYPIEHRQLYYWWEATLNEALDTSFTVILTEGAQVIVYRRL